MTTPVSAQTPRLSEYDLQIPEHLVAQFPIARRDRCRLMVLDRTHQTIESHHFFQLPDFLDEGDVLVLNDTQVFPARLFATREGTGARIEVLLHRELEQDRWEALVKPGRKVQVGERLIFDDEVSGDVLETTPSGGRIIHFHHSHASLHDFIDRHGRPPLPPYIRREPVPGDRETYQTVYACHRGAVAAPTAGLHFTPELLEVLSNKGIQLAYLTLHVGPGTFRPVQVEDVSEHHLEAEFYSISTETTGTINAAKAQGKRVLAVGTTTARALETVAGAEGQITPGEGWTDTFIYPPYAFKVPDGLITNFHQPKSTLIMLVATFAGKTFLFEAYHQAVREEYRFYSYGDAMLII